MPLLGYGPFIPRKLPMPTFLQNLAKKYGPVTGFFLGPQAFVSVVGPQAIKEALLNEDLNGRPSGAIIKSRTFGEKLGNLLNNKIV